MNDENRAERLLTLADALVMGPLLIYNARDVRHPYFKAGLALAGAATVVYALYRLRRRPEPEPEALAGLRRRAALGYYRRRMV